MRFLLMALLCLALTKSASGQICLGLGRDGTCTGISLDGWAESGRKTNGLQLCFVAEDGRCNGLSIGVFPSGRLTGVAVGVFVGGLGYVGALENQTGFVTGLSVGATASAGTLKGVSVALLNKVTTHRGITIGVVNVTNELHGLQIGMINYAANNPKWLQFLPFLNLHL
jgi:hypothetical protein